jgi:hypothetical protein
MAVAKQIHLPSSAGSLNLPIGRGWLVPNSSLRAGVSEVVASERIVITLRDVARILRVPLKRAAVYCDPAKVRVPIPHFVLPAVDGDGIECRIRIYADEFDSWLGDLLRVRSSVRRDQSASRR